MHEMKLVLFVIWYSFLISYFFLPVQNMSKEIEAIAQPTKGREVIVF